MVKKRNVSQADGPTVLDLHINSKPDTNILLDGYATKPIVPLSKNTKKNGKKGEDPKSLFRAKIKLEDLEVDKILEEFKNEFQKRSNKKEQDVEIIADDLISFQRLINNSLNINNGAYKDDELIDQLIVDIAATLVELLGVKPGDAIFAEVMGILMSITERKKSRVVSLLEFMRDKLVLEEKDAAILMHARLVKILESDFSPKGVWDLYGKLLRLGSDYGLELVKADNTYILSTDQERQLGGRSVFEFVLLHMRIYELMQVIERSHMLAANIDLNNMTHLSSFAVSHIVSNVVLAVTSSTQATTESYINLQSLNRFNELLTGAHVGDRGMALDFASNRSSSPVISVFMHDHSSHLQHNYLLERDEQRHRDVLLNEQYYDASREAFNHHRNKHHHGGGALFSVEGVVGSVIIAFKHKVDRLVSFIMSAVGKQVYEHRAPKHKHHQQRNKEPHEHRHHHREHGSVNAAHENNQYIMQWISTVDTQAFTINQNRQGDITMSMSRRYTEYGCLVRQHFSQEEPQRATNVPAGPPHLTLQSIEVVHAQQEQSMNVTLRRQ